MICKILDCNNEVFRLGYCYFCYLIYNISESKTNKMLEKKLRKLHDERIKKGLCMDCGKKLNEEDRKYDPNERKSCKRCFLKQKERVSTASQNLDKIKQDLNIYKGDFYFK